MQIDFLPIRPAVGGLLVLLLTTRAVPAWAADPAPPPEVVFKGAPGQGLTVSVGDGFSLNLRGRLQLRYQLGLPPGTPSRPQQQVSVGTARLWFSGHLYRPELTYMLQLALAARDYRDGAISPIFDAYLDWKPHRDLAVRAGQFFVPFDRLRTVREFALQLADRPRPVGELTLDRDVGIQLYSDRFLGATSPLAWRVGLFGGGGINLADTRTPGALLVGRLELRPLGPIDDDSEGDLERRAAPGLALGIAAARNWNSNRLRSTTGTRFTGGVTDHLHLAADAVFKWRGVALQGEYLWKRASVNAISSTRPDGTPLIEPTRSAHGWIAQASYTFQPPVELVARVSQLFPLRGTDPSLISELDRLGQETALGANYYLNGHRFKVQADWIVRTPVGLLPDFSAADHLLHLQLDLTF